MKLRAEQKGVVLVISMLFMVVLTTIGITALSRAELEERMATNFQEKNRAFQVAETGIAQTLNNLSLFDTEAAQTSSTGTVGEYNASSQMAIDYLDKTNVQRTAKGWGVGAADFFHFNINSVGSGNQSAKADVNRGVRIIGARDE